MRSVLNAGILIAGLSVFGALAAQTANAADDLQDGSIAIVTGTEGSGLRMRAGPSVTQRVLKVIREGERVEILDGPVSDGGFDWYQVSSGGQSGWSNGKYLVATSRAPKSAGPAPVEAMDVSVQTPLGGRSILAKTTGYATGIGRVGTRTATGTTVHWGTVAVDPRVIPFGSQILIDGFSDTVFTAEDRGSAVIGNHIDVFFPEKGAATKYGTQTRKVTIVREGYGR